MIKENEVLLFSGGVDSLTAWFYLKYPRCLYVDLNHRYYQKEIDAVDNLKRSMEKYCEESWDKFIFYTRRLNMGGLEKPDAEIPMRNAFFAMLGSLPLVNFNGDVFGKIDKVWLSFEKGTEHNISNDRSPEFCNMMSNLLTYLNGRKIVVDSPFWNMSKGEIVKWMLGNVLNAEDMLKQTVSCYSSEDGHCGQCPSCFRKFLAFEWAGIDTKGMFNSDITKWEGIKGYVEKFKVGKYDAQRTEEAKFVLSKYRLW